MSAPSARELLRVGYAEEPRGMRDARLAILAARVEAVLAHCEASKGKQFGIRGTTGVVFAQDIERILNGEKP